MLQSLILMSCLNIPVSLPAQTWEVWEPDKKKVLDFNTSVRGESLNSCSPELTLWGRSVRLWKQIASKPIKMRITSSGFILAVLGMVIANKLGGSEPADEDWFAEYEMAKDRGDVVSEGKALDLEVDAAG